MLFLIVSTLICNNNENDINTPKPARIENFPICNGNLKGLFISLFLYRRTISEIFILMYTIKIPKQKLIIKEKFPLKVKIIINATNMTNKIAIHGVLLF